MIGGAHPICYADYGEENGRGNMPDDDEEKYRASKQAHEIGSGFLVKYNLIKKSPAHQPPKQRLMEKYGNDRASTPPAFL